MEQRLAKECTGLKPNQFSKKKQKPSQSIWAGDLRTPFLSRWDKQVHYRTHFFPASGISISVTATQLQQQNQREQFLVISIHRPWYFTLKQQQSRLVSIVKRFFNLNLNLNFNSSSTEWSQSVMYWFLTYDRKKQKLFLMKNYIELIFFLCVWLKWSGWIRLNETVGLYLGKGDFPFSTERCLLLLHFHDHTDSSHVMPLYSGVFPPSWFEDQLNIFSFCLIIW